MTRKNIQRYYALKHLIRYIYYPTALRRVQIRAKRVKISRDICTPEDRLDRFSRNAQATNWIEVTKKMAENLSYFSDDEESEWLANIVPSLLDKSNEEDQGWSSDVGARSRQHGKSRR